MTEASEPFAIRVRMLLPEDLPRLRAEALSQTSYTESELRDLHRRHTLTPREVSILTELDSLDFLLGEGADD